MKVKIKSCMTFIVIFIALIVLCFVDFPDFNSPSNMSNYNSAMKRYKESGDSEAKVRRAYQKLNYSERKQLDKK